MTYVTIKGLSAPLFVQDEEEVEKEGLEEGEESEKPEEGLEEGEEKEEEEKEEEEGLGEEL